MALSMQQALAQYGTLGALANAVPDLKAKLEQGAREEWTPDLFFAEIQQTGWWKGSSETRRQAQILQTTDPATWQQQVSNQTERIRAMAQEMGIAWNPQEWIGLAHTSLSIGMDEGLMRNAIGAMATSGVGGNFAGAAADLDKQIRAVYGSQGIGFTDGTMRSAVSQILAGRQTIGSYENQAREAAKSRYPNLAAQLDAGLTVRDIASPYMAQIAQTLEIPETDITLQDSHVQKALTDRDEKGVPRTKPLWQFERELKDDPRWDKTKNAANQTYDLLARVGQDWGFSA